MEENENFVRGENLLAEQSLEMGFHECDDFINLESPEVYEQPWSFNIGSNLLS